jgi:hypothetical protein
VPVTIVRDGERVGVRGSAGVAVQPRLDELRPH